MSTCISLEFLNTKFYVMKSKVPTTAPVIFVGLLRLKKRSTEKKTPWERLFRGDRFLSLRMFRYRYWRSSIPLRNVLRQENRDLSSKIHRVSKVEVPRIYFSSVFSCKDLLISSLHRSANIWIFIYLKSSFTWMFIWTQFFDQLTVGLLERCSGIAEVMGSNPVRGLNFFQVLFVSVVLLAARIS